MPNTILKYTLWIIARTIILLALIGGIYYAIWLEPDRQLAATLTNLEQNLAPHYLTLLTNRLSFFELARLDINRSDYLREKEGIMANLVTTRDQNRDLLETDITLEQPKKFLFTPTRRLQNKLVSSFADLRQQHQQVLTDQAQLINTLEALDKAITKLAAYPAQQDLTSLDPQAQRPELIIRANNAKNALIDIRAAIDRINIPASARQTLAQKLTATIDSLSDIITRTEQEEQQIDSLITTINQTVDSFESLQQSIVNSYVATLQQDDSAQLLTRETNTVLGYKYLLDLVSYQQGRIYQQYVSTEG